MTVSNSFFIRSDPAGVAYESDKGQAGFGASIEMFARAVRRHILAVAAIVVAAVVLALLLTLFATPQYTSTARIEIAREAARITNVQGLESDQKNQDLEFYETQYALLTARTVAERVARELGVVSNDRLFETYDFDIDAAIEAKRAVPGENRGMAALRLEQATDLLLSHVAIRPVAGSSLVDVNYTSPSAELSAQVANLWVDEFQAATIDRRFSSTAEARDYLEGRLAELRQRLEASQRQLVSYAANNEIVTLATDQDSDGNTEASETLRVRDLRALNDALATATAQRIAAESQARSLGTANQNSLSNIALNSLRERRAEVAAELAHQLTIFEPEYPAVEALQARLEQLDNSIAREEGRIRTAAQSSYREAAMREQALRRRVDALKSDALDEQRDSIQYAIFQREVDTNRELYEGLLQRYKEIGVAGVGANNISVVDRGLVPTEPTSPSLPLNMALGLLLGFGLAGAYVFIREQLDQSIRDPAHVSDMFGLSLLGAIPVQVSDDVEHDLLDPKAAISEAYFSTASNLSFLTANGAPRSLAVTSTRPNEGKSTTAFALAIALARIGKRVVLIDCDLRNPSLHELLDVKREDGGLSQLLSSGADPRQVTDVIEKTDIANMDFLPAGRIPPNPGALLSNDLMSKIVHQLTDVYDIVIVDGPPMLGLADAPLVAKSVEGVIYTIEANGVKIRAIQTSLRRLQFAAATIFGAVVTKLNSANTAYGYGYGYGYGYSYGSNDGSK